MEAGAGATPQCTVGHVPRECHSQFRERSCAAAAVLGRGGRLFAPAPSISQREIPEAFTGRRIGRASNRAIGKSRMPSTGVLGRALSGFCISDAFHRQSDYRFPFAAVRGKWSAGLLPWAGASPVYTIGRELIFAARRWGHTNVGFPEAVR